jgi:beta-glucanase (GH16 family)
MPSTLLQVSSAARERAHARHRWPAALLALALAGVACAPKAVAPPQKEEEEQQPEPPPTAPRLVWSDEFESGTLPDTARWFCEWGPNWYNGELQYYTNCRHENVRVQDGMLVLEARHEPFGGREYTSTRLDSKPGWTYGRMEVRARLPRGGGLWPAIWMLPSTTANGGWPRSGELDIMENWSSAPDVIAGTAHTEAYNHTIGTARGGSIKVSAPYDGFHVYAIAWTPAAVTWSVDSVAYYKFARERDDVAVWPFDKPFRFLLNIAIESSTPGQEGSWVKRTMEIDWVRVYQ